MKPEMARAYVYKHNYAPFLVFFTKYRACVMNKPQDSATLSELEVLGCRWWEQLYLTLVSNYYGI